MGSLGRIACSALCAGILLMPSATPVSGQTSRQEWLKRCGIVFVGRVVKVGDVSFADVPRSARTVVVHVDEVLEKPAAVSLVRGDKVTVEVKEPSRLRKGARDGQEIVIRFPGSLDVAWYRAPKFKLGQEGTFFLQRDTLSGSPKAVLAGAEVDAYIAGSRQDVLPRNEAQRVRALVGP